MSVIRLVNLFILLVGLFGPIILRAADGPGISYLGIEHGLSNNSVTCIFQDHRGFMWFGTYEGLNRYDGYGFKVFRSRLNDSNSLPNNRIAAIIQDRTQRIWIGTRSGAARYDEVTSTFSAINYFSRGQKKPVRITATVNDLKTDNSGNVFIATDEGMYLYEETANAAVPLFIDSDFRQPASYQALSIDCDKKGNVWIYVREKGLYLYNPSHKTFRLVNDEIKNGICLKSDDNGGLWMGTDDGLYTYSIKNKVFSKLFSSGNRTVQLARYENSLFISCDGNGIFTYDCATGKVQPLLQSSLEHLTGKMTRFSETEGLTNNAILKIVEDGKGYLWISTFKGLSLFNTVTKKFVNFSQSDGLQSNQFSYNAGLKLNSGEIVFGGIKGLNIFLPDSIINRKRPLTVLLSGLRVNNIPVQATDGYISKRGIDKIERITLPFDKAVLAIDFVALNYSASDKISYAYYLEGWDKGWSHVGKARTANYTRLNEGTYVFHVKAKDAATGDWNEWEDQLVIKILPPWYRAWWAYLLYITAGCTLIYLYIRYKSERNKQAYEIALARIETEKQKELNEKKLSFFTNIAHEFRAPLTLIIDPVKELLHNPEQRPGAVGLHIVYRNARRLLSLVDQLLLFRKAEIELDNLKRVRVNFYELCHEVFICFSPQAKSRNIDYEFSGINPSLELMVDPEKMEIILFNLLSNALKFTPAGGRITFEIVETAQVPRMVEVTISDTGCGIDPSTGDRLFEKFYQGRNGHNATQKGFGIGLYLVSQFVHAHEGTIAYRSEKKTGTRFIMTLPYNEFSGQPTEPNDWSVDQSAGRKPVFLEELIADLEADTDTGKNRSTPRTGTDDKRPALPDIISEKKSILLVDDNTGIREYLNNIFTDRFLVYEAESGEDGLELAVSHMPDIIISDVIMNGMTGVDFCTKIKADPELNHIPVILLTATTSSDIKLKGIECGAEDYITKPFEKELLIARVDNILKNRNTIQQYFLDTVTLRKDKTKVSGSYRDFLDRCIEVIEKEIDNENFTIKSFAIKMGMSHSSLYKKVKSVSGLSLNAFIRFLRLRKAALLLLSTDTNINEVAFQVGFGDTKYFRSQFNKLFGMNPSEYIKKYKSNFNKDYNVVG